LKTMFGFLPPRTGRITLRGADISAQPSHERASHGVAFVPQHRSLFGELSVHDNLLLGCWPFRADKTRVRQRIDSVYDRFPILAQKRDDPVSSMSGGQQ
ncbi:ATP-binding cassette domain-containing protein, partial [Pseudomonas aeruginosa]